MKKTILLLILLVSIFATINDALAENNLSAHSGMPDGTILLAKNTSYDSEELCQMVVNYPTCLPKESPTPGSGAILTLCPLSNGNPSGYCWMKYAFCTDGSSPNIELVQVNTDNECIIYDPDVCIPCSQHPFFQP
jgi:hypothetical protein